jgi:archaellum component FlaC
MEKREAFPTRKSPREIAEIVENAMHEFNVAMQHRHEFSGITRRRTTQILWFSMGGLILLASAMFYLIHILTRDTHTITLHVIKVADYMDKINHTLVSVSQDIQNMKQSVGSMNGYMSVIPAISDSVEQVSQDLLGVKQDIGQINRSIGSMSGDIAVLNQRFDTLNNQLVSINYQINGLNGHVGRIGYDVDRVAAPMRFFPFAPQ